MQAVLDAYRGAALHLPGVECRIEPPISIGEVGGEVSLLVEQGPAVGDNTLVAGWLLITTPEGRGTLVLDMDDFEPAMLEWQRDGGQTLGQCWPDPVVLNPVLTLLFGVVVDDSGPVGGAFVTGCGGTSTSAEDGTWIMRVAPAMCSVRAWREVDGLTLAGSPREVELLEGDDVQLDLSLPAGPPGFAGLGLAPGERSWTVSLIESDAAYEAGIRVGDQIESVGGQSARGLDRTQIGLAMSGLPGEPITVSIRRGEDTATFTWVRSIRDSPN